MAKQKIEYAGIDGCKSGWLYVGIDDKGQFHFGVKSKFEDVISILKDARLILVDMPIGLPSSRQTKRHCDVAARKAISPRGLSQYWRFA
jgi:predicted RNase H-like nuclease